ncbi:MAG TPA: hypothetical protein VHQ94_10015 [Pyrinomonadaceae bacterium]|jgi:hypothetical protein|nr:hypothetical protein [Pyrinomonadaceae bacterium]
MFPRLLVVLLLLSLTFPPAIAQEKPVKPKKAKAEEVDAEAEQQREIAVALVISLADEARSFKDQARRARIQARAADVLWDSDAERARELFKRAWEAADAADTEAAQQRAEQIKKMQAAGEPVVLRGGPNLRNEVLRIVAKRDYKLCEEFLKVFDEANAKATEEAASNARRNSLPEQLGSARRLELARRLLEDGDVERAWIYALPALYPVSVDSIFFLSALREKDASRADKAFDGLLARAQRDPTSDANTVSGLSSYALTPFFYIWFEKSGGANQNQSRRTTQAPDLPPRLKRAFLELAFEILMRPLPAPDQDRSTSGHLGKFMVIKRLLPVFEQEAADLAAGLRTQMTALASYVPPDAEREANRDLTAGLRPDEEVDSDRSQRMQERLDAAKTSDERDQIYADFAVMLTEKGDLQARELVDKIENSELRKNVRAYTDFEWAEYFIRKKDATEATRLAKNGELTSLQRVWIYTRAAKLVLASERAQAIDLLNDALTEGRRIGNSDPDRARALTAVATRMAEIDMVRAWEILGEVIKAANAADAFTGEDSRIYSRLQTKNTVVVSNGTAEDFDLLGLFRQLARADLLRSVQLTKSFTGYAPRAVATLAIAQSVLEKRKDRA